MLVHKLKIAIVELLEANNLLPADHPADIPFALLAERR